MNSLEKQPKGESFEIVEGVFIEAKVHELQKVSFVAEDPAHEAVEVENHQRLAQVLARKPQVTGLHQRTIDNLSEVVLFISLFPIRPPVVYAKHHYDVNGEHHGYCSEDSLLLFSIVLEERVQDVANNQMLVVLSQQIDFEGEESSHQNLHKGVHS